jgi:hypothetical protein
MSELQPRSEGTEITIAEKIARLVFFSKTDSLIYTLLDMVKSQKEVIKLPDEYALGLSYDQLRKLEEFGIFKDSSIIMDKSKRKYLIIIEPEWETDLDTHCLTYCAKYLPEDVEPDYFVLNRQFNDFEDWSKWVSIMQEVFPGIQAFTDQSYLNSMNSFKSLGENVIQQIRDHGYVPMEIGDILDSVVQEHTGNNHKTLELFKGLEEVVLSFQKKNPNLLLVTGKHHSYLPMIGAYMFYKHGIPTYLGESYVSSYLSRLGWMYFGENTLTLEAQIEYLKNLPKIGLQFSSRQELAYVVYLNTTDMETRIMLDYVPFEGSGDVATMELDIRDLAIIPLEDEFEIGSPTVSGFQNAHRQVLLKYVKLSEDLGGRSIIPTVFNTLIIEMNDTKYFAFMRSLTVNVEGVLIPLDSEMSKVKKTFSLEDIRKLYPVNVLPGYKDTLIPIMKTVAGIMSATEGFVGSLSKAGVFPKVSDPLGLIIWELSTGKNTVKMNLESVTNHITSGLWWPEGVKYRVNLTDKVSLEVNVNESRKREGFFSMFGGPTPVTGYLLTLDERVLSRDAIKFD